MAELSVIWLRVAAALYSLGLLHAILMLVRRREHLFQVAFTAFTLGTVFHFVSIIEEGIVNNRCPRSEEHTSELQSLRHLACRLLLEKKKSINRAGRSRPPDRPRQCPRIGRPPV